MNQHYWYELLFSHNYRSGIASPRNHIKIWYLSLHLNKWCLELKYIYIIWFHIMIWCRLNCLLSNASIGCHHEFFTLPNLFLASSTALWLKIPSVLYCSLLGHRIYSKYCLSLCIVSSINENLQSYFPKEWLVGHILQVCWARRLNETITYRSLLQSHANILSNLVKYLR